MVEGKTHIQWKSRKHYKQGKESHMSDGYLWNGRMDAVDNVERGEMECTGK